MCNQVRSARGCTSNFRNVRFIGHDQPQIWLPAQTNPSFPLPMRGFDRGEEIYLPSGLQSAVSRIICGWAIIGVGQFETVYFFLYFVLSSTVPYCGSTKDGGMRLVQPTRISDSRVKR